MNATTFTPFESTACNAQGCSCQKTKPDYAYIPQDTVDAFWKAWASPQAILSEPIQSFRDQWPIAATILGFTNTVLLVVLLLAK